MGGGVSASTISTSGMIGPVGPPQSHGHGVRLINVRFGTLDRGCESASLTYNVDSTLNTYAVGSHRPCHPGSGNCTCRDSSPILIQPSPTPSATASDTLSTTATVGSTSREIEMRRGRRVESLHLDQGPRVATPDQVNEVFCTLYDFS